MKTPIQTPTVTFSGLITVPPISRIETFKRPSRPIRWVTDITFDNAVVIGFTGRMHGVQAQRLATEYYANCIDAGFTEAEMIDSFAPKPVNTHDIEF